MDPVEVGTSELPTLPAEWQEEYLEHDRCKVFVPQGSAFGIDTTFDTSDGNLADYIKYSGDRCALVIEFTHGPLHSTFSEDLEGSFDKGMSRIVKLEEKRAGPAKVKSVRDITLFGNPGREMIMTQHEGKTDRKIWIVYTDRAILQVNFICHATDNEMMEKRNAFFESIRFVEE